ncbi:hypothetical protein J4406_02295 [Candidatus Woesearchaeota archaeon]|nr:hypothetical protein [Candidatus Woesearchaeota archaeon]
MRKWLHNLEIFFDRAIPYVILLLIFIIVGEFAFHNFMNKYRLYVSLADYVIVGFFIIDLGFKFYRVRNVKLFFKKYWLEVIAVFPFVLVFRLFEELALLLRFTEPLEQGQKVLHGITEGIQLGEEQKIIRELQELEKGTRTFRSIQESTKLSRTTMFLRFMRLPRLARAVPVYEKPIKKEIKVIEEKLGIKKRR